MFKFQEEMEKKVFLEKIKEENLKKEYLKLKRLIKRQGWKIKYEDARLNQGYLHINHYMGAFLPVMVIEKDYTIEIYPEGGAEEMCIFPPKNLEIV